MGAERQRSYNGNFSRQCIYALRGGDCPNAFLVGSIIEEGSKIVLRDEIEKEYKFYEEQFEKRMVAIGVY